jgi:acyl-CoA synthetase (AMP-forming)/AMP-acid ligase II
VHSQSKAQGYWNLPDISAQQFNANILLLDTDDNPSSDGYLRTGDLGFIHRSELYVCGRLKDLIEKTVETVVGEIRTGCSAAFASRNEVTGTEKVIYVAEVSNFCILCLLCAYITCARYTT